MPQDALCPCDKVKILPDGHNIPWETILGNDNLGFDIVLSIGFYDQIFDYFNNSLIGTGRFKAEVGFRSYDREDRGHKFININDLKLFFIFTTELSISSYAEKTIARDQWVLERCKKIEYLPSKAEILEEIFFKLKIK